MQAQEGIDVSNEYLDILGQQPLMKVYTQICFCFPVADESSYSAVVATLTSGLERLSASFPWIAGQVVNKKASDGDSGVFKFEPLEKIPRLIVKDLRHDPSIPTMDAMRQANFPFHMLDENIIAPRNTLPGNPNESDVDSAPVFLLQASPIVGGLLLCFVAHHSTMDMTGQGQIIRLISKACRNEPFSDQELSSGNLTRHNLIPLLDDAYEQGSELSYQIVKPIPSQTSVNDSNNHAETLSPPECSWAYFTFHPASLTALKLLATKSMAKSSGYVSTDDTLSAFIWQSITRVRLGRLNPKTESTLARAVDVRRYLKIPQTYPGLVQNMTYHTLSLHKLVEEPLGSIASQLRLAVDPKTSDMEFRTRAIATVLERASDKSMVSFTATIDLSQDIMLSSWAKVECYDLDFGLGLGMPEAVRRPRFDPVESLIYLLPKAPDGEIVVAICLRNEDMERLKADEAFAKYSRYIG